MLPNTVYEYIERIGMEIEQMWWWDEDFAEDAKGFNCFAYSFTSLWTQKIFDLKATCLLNIVDNNAEKVTQFN